MNIIDAWTMRKFLLAMVAGFGLSGCGYNTFQTTDEQIKVSFGASGAKTLSPGSPK